MQNSFSFITYRFPALHAVRSDCLLYYSLTFYACCAINSYRQYIIAYGAPVRIKYIKHALCNILKCIICNYLYSSISIMRLQSVEYLFLLIYILYHLSYRVGTADYSNTFFALVTAVYSRFLFKSILGPDIIGRITAGYSLPCDLCIVMA